MFTPKLRNYINSTINYRVYKKLDHISGLSQIIKRFIHPPQDIVISISHCYFYQLNLKKFDYRLILSVNYLYKVLIKLSLNNNFVSISYSKFLFNSIMSFKISLICFIFKKSNKSTKKSVNRFLQDGARAGIRSLQTSIVIKLCQTPGNGL